MEKIMYRRMFNVVSLSKLSMPRLMAISRRLSANIATTRGDKVLKDDSPPRYVGVTPVSIYGGEQHVSLLTGRSSMVKQAANYITDLFTTAKVPVFFENIVIKANSDQSEGQRVVDEFLLSVRRNRCAIYVDIQHSPQDKHSSLLLASELDLYACIMKMESFNGFNCRHPEADLMLVIQNNSGDYSKLEYEPKRGVVQTLKMCDEKVLHRFIRFMFTQAKKHNRRKVTFAHRVNEIAKTDGMFLEVACEVRATSFQDIEIEFLDVNKLVRQLILRPHTFDVICAGDRYGTLLASVSAAVCGGASLFSSIERGDHHAVFKPLQTRLSLSDIKVLSPYGVVRSCIDLLRHLGNDECAEALWSELMRTMLVDKVRTTEFGGSDEPGFVICNIVNRLKCSKF